MKKFFLCFVLFANLLFAEEILENNFTLADDSHIEIIDLNITPINLYNAQQDLNLSKASKEGTFIKVASAEARASTQDEAVKLAIINAASKIKGINLSQLSQSLASQKFTNSALNTLVSLQTSKENALKGFVDAYEITEILADMGDYKASVNVYKTLFERSQKPHLLIIDNSKSSEIAAILEQKILSAFTQEGNFSVLDRKNDKFYEAEKALIQSEDGSSEDFYKLGNVFGADYALIFDLRNLKVNQAKPSNLSTSKTSRKKLEASLDYRLILFATREIKVANTLSVDFYLKDDSLKTQEQALDKIAKLVLQDLESRLYGLGVQEQSLEQNKGANYELGKKGGVNLGF